MSERIVLGLTVTVDKELVWDAPTVQAQIARFRISAEEIRAPGPAHDLRSMFVTLLANLASGSGSELYVSSPGPLAEMVDLFDHRTTLGGTGVRAGVALAAMGVPSAAVMAAADPDVHRLLPSACRPVAAEEVASLVPHVIVQYPAGAQIQLGPDTVVSPGPNRVIFAHDRPNMEVQLPSEFPELATAADCLLLSSLNAIQDERLLQSRTQAITNVVQAASPVFVMWEDAAYHVHAHALTVARSMASLVDVFSLNEDELQAYLERRVDLLNVEDVRHALLDLHELIPAGTFVVHTKYWCLASGDRSGALRRALSGGITMASARYCFGDSVNPEQYAVAKTWPHHSAGLAAARGLDGVDGLACVPGLVPPTATPTTIGLGDSFVGGFLEALRRDPTSKQIPPAVPQATTSPR